MDTFEKNGMELSWSAPERLIRARITEPHWVGTGESARALVTQMHKWTNGLSGRYAVLVDCSSMISVDAAWRAIFYRHLRAEAERARIAWFNASPFVKVIITMFILAVRFQTSFEGRAFDTKVQAEAWLQGLVV